jgi:hypothetical protein
MRRIIFNRLLYVIIGAFIGVSLAYIGCGPSGTNNNKSLVIPARNILFRNTQKNAVAKRKAPTSTNFFSNIFVSSAYSQDTDETTQILAENVLLETDANSLESRNLQDALDNEMAIDIPSALSGKTWSLENKSGISFFNNTLGQITFSSSSSFTVDSGTVGVTGMKSEAAAKGDNEWSSDGERRYTNSATIEFISNKVMFVTWTAIGYNGVTDATFREVVQIIPVDKTKFILTGFNPVTGHDGVSTLSLVE